MSETCNCSGYPTRAWHGHPTTVVFIVKDLPNYLPRRLGCRHLPTQSWRPSERRQLLWYLGQTQLAGTVYQYDHLQRPTTERKLGLRQTKTITWFTGPMLA